MLDLLRSWLPRVRADMAPLHALGTDLAPLSEGVPDVRMESERVVVTLYPLAAVVEAAFLLANEGPETRFPVGFPAYGRPGPFKSTESGLMDFQVEVDGRMLEPRREVHRNLGNRFYPTWITWAQAFPAGRTLRVVVRYWTPLSGYAGASRVPFTYVLRTGRFWKGGRIGRVEVLVRARGIPIEAIREITPAGHVVDREARRIRWLFHDHVPEADVGLLISPVALLAREMDEPLLDPFDVQEVPVGRTVTVLGTPFTTHSGACRHP